MQMIAIQSACIVSETLTLFSTIDLSVMILCLFRLFPKLANSNFDPLFTFKDHKLTHLGPYFRCRGSFFLSTQVPIKFWEQWWVDRNFGWNFSSQFEDLLNLKFQVIMFFKHGLEEEKVWGFIQISILYHFHLLFASLNDFK